ncbi:MAG: Hsp20/alpha crystallin family protein [Chloroflexi bacterium]|nr:Hsp20/alpha crystallin family protein [Chloroflexota bacterium]
MSDSPERWWQAMDSMQQEMERFLSHFHGSKPPPLYFSSQVWEPAADVYETQDAVLVLIELPGIKRDSIEIVVEGHILMVRGNRPEEGACSQGSYCQMEIQRGPFERRLHLPGPVEGERTAASYEDGILRILLQKPAPQHVQRLHIHTRE